MVVGGGGRGRGGDVLNPLCLLQVQPAERAGGVRFPAEELTAERRLQLPRVQLLLLLERAHRPRLL